MQSGEVNDRVDRIERTLNQFLGQLLENSVGTDQVFRFLVVAQELIQQLGRRLFRLAHGISGLERQCRSWAGYTKIRTPSGYAA
jgi:hypothetical protein